MVTFAEKEMDALIQRVGNTPLVKLTQLDGCSNANVFLKMESLNPSGSVKDRPAKLMIQNAIRNGKIGKGGMLIEPTSGNTGIGLAWIGKRLGLKVVIVMPDSVSAERVKLLDLLGAEVVLTNVADGMQGAISEAKLIHKNNPSAWMPLQFSNPDNPLAHYQSTGPEIWEALDGKVDILLAGVGTGGTLCGTALYLKQHYPKLKVFAVEPADSKVLRGGKPAMHKIAGISPGFIPKNYRSDLVDAVLPADDNESILMRRTLANAEGLSCGISTGANVLVALQLAKSPMLAGKNIVTFACDSGERYLSLDY